MLFAVSWDAANRSEEQDKRGLKLFAHWHPPAGVEFKGFYDYADGNGGLALVETASSELLLETVAPWASFFRFSIRPIVPTDQASKIFEKAVAWRDSIR